MASRPKISDFHPRQVLSKRATNIYLKGESFQVGAVLYLDSVVIPATVLEESRVHFLLPGTYDAGIYDLYLVNPDGGRSNIFQLAISSNKSAIPNYIKNVVDQRVQPLPPPFQSRDDLQRVLAGSQFDGKLPDAEPGKWGTLIGPTQGGRWTWGDPVYVNQFEFKSNGTEGGARGAGSGLFIHHYDSGLEVRVLDLENTLADIVIPHNQRFRVAQGDELILRTFGATLEMVGIPTVQIDRPYL